MLEGDDSFPSVYNSADEAAKNAQVQFLRFQLVELVSLVLAAIFLELSFKAGSYNVTGLIGGTCLLTAVGARIAVMIVKPEKSWYDGRALAESVKTMTWQYAVGGSAFPKTMSVKEADQLFVSELASLRKGLSGVSLPVDNRIIVITEDMRRVRSSNLSDRRKHYVAGRVEDQQEWYRAKAKWNRTRARNWGLFLLTLEALALVVALLRGLNLFDIDWAGILVAAAAAVVAWRQTKQFSALAEAYSVTSFDVGEAATALALAQSEDDWAEAVHNAESAFSREHTMWRARRQR